MLAVHNDPDPTLQALLRPLMLLDSQPQHALDLGNSLRELEDEIDDAPVPRCLPMIRFCIQTMERMVTEMLILSSPFSPSVATSLYHLPLPFVVLAVHP